MTDTTKLKTELGRIRGAIMSGSFDRDTAIDALDKAEKALDAPTVGGQADKSATQAFSPKPATPTNPVPDQVGKPFVPGGTILSPTGHDHKPV